MIAVSRRPPHLAFMCALCILSGVSIVVSGPTPGSIQEALHPVLVQAWAASLIACGAAILVTFFDRVAVRGLRRERLMLWPLSIATMAYAGAILGSAGGRGAFAAGLCLAFVGANFVRVWQITRWLRALDAARPTDG